MAAGGVAPREYSEGAPWTACFRLVALEERFWNEQVRHPVAAWLASGGHGSPKPLAEAFAVAHLPGLAADGGDMDERCDRRRQANRDKRLAKRKRWAAGCRERRACILQEHKSKKDFNHKGKGKGRDQLLWWAKGVGPCAGLEENSQMRVVLFSSECKRGLTKESGIALVRSWREDEGRNGAAFPSCGVACKRVGVGSLSGSKGRPFGRHDSKLASKQREANVSIVWLPARILGPLLNSRLQGVPGGQTISFPSFV